MSSTSVWGVLSFVFVDEVQAFERKRGQQRAAGRDAWSHLEPPRKAARTSPTPGFSA